MAQLEHHPLQPLLDATQPYLTAMDKLTKAIEAQTAAFKELTDAANMLQSTHSQLLEMAGLQTTNPQPPQTTTEQAASNFVSSDDKRLVHATIEKISQLGKNKQLLAILNNHHFYIKGDTADTIRQKIGLCPDWQAIRALLNDLLPLATNK